MRISGFVWLCLLLAGCAPTARTAVVTVVTARPVPVITPQVTPSPRPTLTSAPVFTALPPSPTVTPPQLLPSATLGSDDWKSWPVIPTTVSDRAREIYRRGLMMGNNPHAFSKVGDCNSVMPYFMGEFDDPQRYRLGDFASLQAAVDYFHGSFSRRSLAAKNGLSAGASLVTLWSDWKVCAARETPLDCEYRVNRPSFAIIALGSNDVGGVDAFEPRLRRVIERTIADGVVPILATKADNLEGHDQINRIIARLAYEYDVPLWNWWAAAHTLPDYGLRDGEHLTYSGDHLADFSDPAVLTQYAWPLRNLTALQVLDAVWHGVTGP